MSNNTPDYDNLYFACNKTQANDLACNKISLTSQWRKGELPDGWYWVKKKTCEEYIDKVYFWYDTFIDGDVPLDNDKVIEVLDYVPSYEKWRNMVNCACEEHEANKRLIEENDKLKELLAIAVEALKEYGNCENWNNIYDSESADFEPLYWANKWKDEYGYKYAQEKLKQIKDLNK